jgi:hypothetical protein
MTWGYSRESVLGADWLKGSKNPSGLSGIRIRQQNLPSSNSPDLERCNPAPYTMATGRLFPGVKATGALGWPLPSTAEFKNLWSYTSNLSVQLHCLHVCSATTYQSLMTQLSTHTHTHARTHITHTYTSYWGSQRVYHLSWNFVYSYVTAVVYQMMVTSLYNDFTVRMNQIHLC